MKKKATKRTVVWAIDPMDAAARPEPKALETLKKMAWSEEVEVQPVYVLSESDVEIPRLLRNPAAEIAAAQKAAQCFLESVGANWANHPVVLGEDSPLVSKAVERLVRYAYREGADFIALTTNGRKGASRLFLGSFAELVLARALLPVFFISHGAKAETSHFGKALFPTDFSTYSAATFERFLAYAKTFGTEVILYHQVPFSPRIEAIAMSAGAFNGLPQNFWSEQESWAKEEAAKWTRKAASLGVRARAIVSNERGDTSEQILKAAHAEGVGMIAMASQSGPFASFVFGSVARGVFRPHEIPVWVCGPAFLKKIATIEDIQSEWTPEAQVVS
jgi:nucleotide-binding universal stress UspA family protein